MHAVHCILGPCTQNSPCSSATPQDYKAALQKDPSNLQILLRQGKVLHTLKRMQVSALILAVAVAVPLAAVTTMHTRDETACACCFCTVAFVAMQCRGRRFVEGQHAELLIPPNSSAGGEAAVGARRVRRPAVQRPRAGAGGASAAQEPRRRRAASRRIGASHPVRHRYSASGSARASANTNTSAARYPAARRRACIQRAHGLVCSRAAGASPCTM